VAVLEIHLTSPLWFMAIESLTDKQEKMTNKVKWKYHNFYKLLTA